MKKCFLGADVPSALNEKLGLSEVGNKVLDIGFGDGEIIAQFLDDGYEVLGIETKKAALDSIKQNLTSNGVSITKLKIEPGSVEIFDFPKNTFATIVCQNVLQFVEKNTALESIDKMLEALLPHGFLWLAVHHTDHVYNGKDTKWFVSFYNEEDIEPKFKNKATIIYKAKCWKPEIDESIGLCYLVLKDY